MKRDAVLRQLAYLIVQRARLEAAADSANPSIEKLKKNLRAIEVELRKYLMPGRDA